MHFKVIDCLKDMRRPHCGKVHMYYISLAGTFGEDDNPVYECEHCEKEFALELVKIE